MITTAQGFRLLICLAAALFFATWFQPSDGAASSKPVKIFLDTEELTFPVAPKIKNGTTLVPFRALFEAFDMDVEWDPAQRLVTGKNSEMSISLVIGEKKAIVNGKTYPLLEASEIVNGSTLVPLRFIGESTGALVFWDPFEREISIFTMSYIEANHLTKEAIEEAVDAYLEQRAKEEEEKKKEEEQNKPDPPAKPNQPAKPVDLNDLNGMYYGFRADISGYECGGMCWDFYTFLPNNKVVIGEPKNGGPETINCNTDECLSYSMSNGQLKLSNGKSLPIKEDANGFLMINNVKLDNVMPAQAGTTLNNKYKYIGYSGLIGVTGAATSWTYYLTLNSNGTFELSGVTLGSIGANNGTSTNVGGSGDVDQGTYKIENNTITMTSHDGTVTQSLFFIHDGDETDIQIGSRNYYVN